MEFRHEFFQLPPGSVRAWLAWIAIIALIGVAIWRNRRKPKDEGPRVKDCSYHIYLWAELYVNGFPRPAIRLPNPRIYPQRDGTVKVFSVTEKPHDSSYRIGSNDLFLGVNDEKPRIDAAENPVVWKDPRRIRAWSLGELMVDKQLCGVHSNVENGLLFLEGYDEHGKDFYLIAGESVSVADTGAVRTHLLSGTPVESA